MLPLKCTDEEIAHAYEEFYEDVHTEFLKFGEIVNFKVCRNGSSHLRGNVYVHYKSLDSAVMAYESLHGRYFAGKQVHCEFVVVARWKVAICGEFMKSKLRTCSRGTACNFIHCFRNPGGDYEWADWDKPPPRYWVEKMAALFGYSDETGYDNEIERGSPRFRNSRVSADNADRYRSRRSQSREIFHSRRSKNCSDDGTHKSSRSDWEISHSRRSRNCSDDGAHRGSRSDKMSAHESGSGKHDPDDHRHRRKSRRHRERSYEHADERDARGSIDNRDSDDERDSAHANAEKSSRQSAKLSIRNSEVEHDNDKHDDSSKRYHSRKDGDKSEQEEPRGLSKRRNRVDKENVENKRGRWEPNNSDERGRWGS